MSVFDYRTYMERSMSTIAPCPICQRPDQQFAIQGLDVRNFTCAACGTYSIHGSVQASWESMSTSLSQDQIACASAWVRENGPMMITDTELPALLDLTRPSIGERATKLLQELGKRYTRFGEAIWFEGQMNPLWIAVSWSIDDREVYFLLEHYLNHQKGWINKNGNILTITGVGHDYLDALRSAAPASEPVGFCAMWFAPEVMPVWIDAIKPAIEQAGYDARRIDGVEHNNRIDDEIMAHIRRSRFVVADFTGQRGGVYFEAGFALGLGRPVIWTVRSKDLSAVHFDNRQYNFLQWERENLDDLRKRLQYRIEATVGRGPRRN